MNYFLGMITSLSDYVMHTVRIPHHNVSPTCSLVDANTKELD